MHCLAVNPPADGYIDNCCVWNLLCKPETTQHFSAGSLLIGYPLMSRIVKYFKIWQNLMSFTNHDAACALLLTCEKVGQS